MRSTSGAWNGGRLALIVALLGLVGSVAGAAWFGIQGALGLQPQGVAGGALVLVAAALLVGGLGLVLGGLGFYVLAPGFLGHAMAARGFGSHRLVIAATLLIILIANGPALAYAAYAGPGGVCSVPGFVTAALSVDIALLGVTYLRFIRPGVLTLADLGVGRMVTMRHVGLGLLVGVGVLLVSAVIQSIMQAFGVRQTQLADLQCIRDFPLSGFFGVVLAGGVMAPIAEEVYFRGYVFRSYLQTRGPLVAYGVTSLLFALLHLNPPAIIPIFALSLIFCYVYRQTGSIVPSIIGHAVNNAAAFCILYFTNAPV
ncbi:MAG: lysostaphin resistance A-like protein [Chloroflexota bacterium]